ncbi:AI-2E family transporter [Candidatus Pacearchaeota archaeon]|nr:AI-2E family transporter [Candidatus Pacearchaeota archaeon]
MAGIVIDSEYFRKISTTLVLFVLIVLSFFVLKPILLSLIMGIILAIVFSEPYEILLEKTKSKSISLALTCIFLALLIILPFWFFAPIFVNQAFSVYKATQGIDFSGFFVGIFPSLSSTSFSSELGTIFGSFITKTLNSMLSYFSDWFFDLPSVFLHLIVVFATFFFVLRDSREVLSYISTLTPFSKDVEGKLIKSSKDITLSVIYGQIVIGVVQGLTAGLGFLIFGVPNVVFLTLLSIFAGILPIIGPAIVWVPVIVYLLVAGNTLAAFGVTFFGIISVVIDNFLRPFFISRSSKMHPLLSLLGMIGGFFFFGILGFILGPLILAYVIIILEIYRGKEMRGFLLNTKE